MFTDHTHWLHILLVFSGLFAAMTVYLTTASRYAIIDKPNERSSHRLPTVRGGGVVFIFALLVWFVLSSFPYPWFIGGAVVLAAVSFADDLRSRPAWLRWSVQVIAFCLLSVEVNLFEEAWWLVVVIWLISIGAINAFNFMDGINGMTGLYALVHLSTLFYINRAIVSFTEEGLLVYVIISVVVFLFYNFRRVARCFAGDVGSITLAFIQIFLLLQLILATGNYVWSLLILIYGIDSVVTIVYRLWRRENIFKPHRTHLYQYLANEWSISHRFVSLGYALLQLGVNVFIISFFADAPWWYAVALVVVLGLGYVGVRRVVRYEVRGTNDEL